MREVDEPTESIRAAARSGSWQRARAHSARKARELSFPASLLRLVFGSLAAFGIPLLMPALAAHRWVFIAYVLVASVVQLLIYKNMGQPQVRGLLSGVVDLAVVTFLAHRLGTVTTVIPFLYLVIAVLNCLAVGARVSFALVGIGSVMYLGVLTAELFGWLPYGPDGRGLLPGEVPPLATGLAAGVVFVIALVLTTTLIGRMHIALQRREAELEYLSRYDALTQLFNRRYLIERIGDELERVRRGGRAALLMIDLDGFKLVNDERGHEAGDRLLMSVASALARGTRKVDVVARYGGDEFVMLMPDAGADGAMHAATRLVQNVRESGREAAMSRSVTASVGIAIARRDDDTASLLRRADALAYDSKRAGGDGFRSEQLPVAQASLLANS
jgi:diguanylate cyclase (GGDEF)-like protein